MLPAVSSIAESRDGHRGPTKIELSARGSCGVNRVEQQIERFRQLLRLTRFSDQRSLFSRSGPPDSFRPDLGAQIVDSFSFHSFWAFEYYASTGVH